MMQIKDALQLPVMSETKLVAGHQGINNHIKWVTVVEVLEDVERIQDGEFFITTGFDVMKNKDRFNSIRNLIRSSSVAGVAIYTSFYMSEIPESFIEAANESHLPLIEIPIDINFSEITRAILEQIVNRQTYILAHSERIHSELSHLILNNKTLNEVTTRLAQLTTSKIMIYNEFYEIIYTNQDFPVNHPITSLNNDNFFENIKGHLLESLQQEATKNINYKNDIFTIYPIIAKQECFGWIVMQKKRADWIDLDDIAIERAAMIYAMEFLKKQAIEETHLRMQSNLLEDIFNNNYQNEQIIIDQALKLNYDITRPQSVYHLTFKRKNIDVHFIDRLYKMIEHLLTQKNKPHIIQTKLQSVTFITNIVGTTSEKQQEHLFRLANDLLQEWNYYFPEAELLIGIGTVYEQINKLNVSAREARHATKLYKLVDKNAQIIHYDDLGMYDLLLEMRRKGMDLREIYEESIHALIADQNHEIDFIETLNTYLNHNQSIQKASEQLFIHRHTLRYRLKQIEKRTGLSLKSKDDLLNLQIGVMAYKLAQALQGNSR